MRLRYSAGTLIGKYASQDFIIDFRKLQNQALYKLLFYQRDKLHEMTIVPRAAPTKITRQSVFNEILYVTYFAEN